MSAPAVPAGGASVLDRLQVLRFAPTPLRGAPAATWTQSPRTGVGQLPVPGTGLQPWLHDTTTTSTDPAGSTLATPDFGPKNGVHLMPLSPGTTIGPYHVTAKLGEGGMGEVYRARDTTLDRDVALKVLPEAFTSDPDRLARFRREAKVLASLNHPNIGGIYGLEEAKGTKALVLELVEGPTLADRIAQGPIPGDEALPMATQIAEALETWRRNEVS